jgi:hypothetical protein
VSGGEVEPADAITGDQRLSTELPGLSCHQGLGDGVGVNDQRQGTPGLRSMLVHRVCGERIGCWSGLKVNL